MVLNEGVPVEVFDDLSMDPNSDSYVETSVNEVSEYIEVRDLHAATPLANGAPLYATRVSTNALAGPVALAAGDTLTLAVPDGQAVPAIDLTTLTAPVAPAALVDAVNSAVEPLQPHGVHHRRGRPGRRRPVARAP